MTVFPGLENVCILALFALAVLVEAQPDQETFSIFSNSSDIDPLPASPACAIALVATLQCDANLLSSQPGSAVSLSNLTSTNLTGLCTTTCYQSLVTVTSQVDAACGGWPYILGDTSYIASMPFRWFTYLWNLTCVSNGTGFCLNAAQNSISTEDSSITDLPRTQLCDPCSLTPLNIQMTSPFGWDASFTSDWQSIQTTCGVSFNNTMPNGLLFDPNNPLAANATTSNVTAAPTLSPASTANCVFGSYTVQAGDTCASIASAKSLSYDQLVAINGLDLNCTKLPASGQPICLSGSCPLYTVQMNDTCVQIYQAKGMTWAQLLKWNPQLNSYCTNIDAQVGKGICVGPPGGGYTPTAVVSFVTGTPTALAVPTGAIAPGSDRSICGLWYTAVTGDTCPQILVNYQITNDTFYALNPMVNEDCSNLLAGFAYCVAVFGNTTTTSAITQPTTTGATLIQYLSGEFPMASGFISGVANMTASPSLVTPSSDSFTPPPTPTPTIAPGSIPNSSCLSWYTVQPGDTCFAIETLYGMSDAEFRLWNPEVNAGCSNIQVGLAYCVFGPAIITTPSYPVSLWPTTSSSSTTSTTSGTPAPTNVASGTITTECTSYYTVKSGDSCGAIDSQFAISLSQFLAWNPEVNTGCTNIQVGLAYCVSGPTSTAPAVPTNVASGSITTGCTTYYTVKSGDSCGAIDSQFSITLSQFLAWNPEVNSGCTNIQVGLAYCVSGPASTTSSAPVASPTAPGTITSGCTAYYTVVSGDSCPKIESQFGITLAQFIQWNPEVDANCDNIVIGLQYCVAGPAPSSTTTSAPPASPTASGSFTPAQGCTKYYTIASGDSCSLVESKFSITSAQFAKWNPEILADCSNLQLGVEYCVAGP